MKGLIVLLNSKDSSFENDKDKTKKIDYFTGAYQDAEGDIVNCTMSKKVFEIVAGRNGITGTAEVKLRDASVGRKYLAKVVLVDFVPAK